MNGRVYDPALGRFLSADPNVDGVEDAQGFNRYSYVGNNPMNATDPSGYFKLKDALKIVAVIAAGILTAGAAIYAVSASFNLGLSFAASLSAITGVATSSLAGAIFVGASAGFGSGFAGSLLNGGSIGDAFKAGVIGGIVGGISAGIAHGIGDFAANHEWFKGAGQHLAHGVAQGGLTELQGGEFRHGFYAGFAASAAAGPIRTAMPDSMAGRTVAAAVVGGTASALGGGKFANGAVSGAFTHLFNDEVKHLRRRESSALVVIPHGADFQKTAQIEEGSKQLGSFFDGLLSEATGGMIDSAFFTEGFATINLAGRNIAMRSGGVDAYAVITYRERGFWGFWAKPKVGWMKVPGPTGDQHGPFPWAAQSTGRLLQNPTFRANYKETHQKLNEEIFGKK